MARENREWTVEQGGGALAAELHRILEVSHRQAKGLLDAGCVKVNGKEVRVHGQRLADGDRVQVLFDATQTYRPLPQILKETEDEEVRILWEDKHLVFVDKPAGLLTVPTETTEDRSLADALKDHYARLGQKRMTLYVVHRLDRHTSGVLVFAKTSEAMHALRKVFETHDLKRVYRAVLVGELPENAGTLTDKLVEKQKRLIMSVAKGREAKRSEGKQAVTHYRVVERLPGHTVVEVTLETGRRNQIRVQFAERGFPLLGDRVYGHASPLLDRQALHAELLGLRHPVKEDPVTVTAPLPADLEAALKALRTERRVARAEVGLQGAEGIYQPRISKARKQARVRRALKFGETDGAPEGPRDSRSREDRPRDDRPREDRPRSAGSSKDRPRSDRPRDDRPRDDRPRGPRTSGGRPARGPGAPRGGRPEGGTPASSGKPRTPRKPYADRPEGERPPRPSHPGPRPRPGATKDRSFEGAERPRPRRREEEGARPERPRSPDRPIRARDGEGQRSRAGENRPGRPAGARPERGSAPRRPEDRPRPSRPFRAKEGDSRPSRPGGGERSGPGRPRTEKGQGSGSGKPARAPRIPKRPKSK